MRFEDIYKSNYVAGYITEAASNREPFMGEAFFPNDRTVGLSIDWLKQTLGVNVMLNVSNLDAQPKIRTREGFQTENTEMALFRESMHVRERDMLMLAMAENENNPYVRQAMAHAFDDVSKLVDAADIAILKIHSKNRPSPGIRYAINKTPYIRFNLFNPRHVFFMPAFL